MGRGSSKAGGGGGSRTERAVSTMDVENKVYALSNLAGALESTDAARNARDALNDMYWYSRTGRGNMTYDSDIVNLTDDQAMTLLNRLGKAMRSRDKNISLAKRALAELRNQRLKGE